MVEWKQDKSKGILRDTEAEDITIPFFLSVVGVVSPFNYSMGRLGNMNLGYHRSEFAKAKWQLNLEAPRSSYPGLRGDFASAMSNLEQIQDLKAATSVRKHMLENNTLRCVKPVFDKQEVCPASPHCRQLLTLALG